MPQTSLDRLSHIPIANDGQALSLVKTSGERNKTEITFPQLYYLRISSHCWCMRDYDDDDDDEDDDEDDDDDDDGVFQSVRNCHPLLFILLFFSVLHAFNTRPLLPLLPAA